MISFSQLGIMGRLGNQLFQYAFLRTTAQRLGVKFYCPEWIGDSVFLLQDEEERATTPHCITQTFVEPECHTGFQEECMQIEDGTDIRGYFQTARYYRDEEKVKRWFTFKEEKLASVRRKYDNINFSKSLAVHLRFTDMRSDSDAYVQYYLPSREYYVRAISEGQSANVLVFSDDMDAAKRRLGDWKSFQGNVVFVEGNEDYEDLHLMSLCHDNVCSISTFSWWGAYLNSHANKTVIVPMEGPFRPGCPITNKDYWCEGWMQRRAFQRRGFNDYRSLSVLLSFLRLLPRDIRKTAWRTVSRLSI